MTADHSSEQGRQRTVAELLQQYGGATGSSGRRRRRGGQPPEEPAAQPGGPEVPSTATAAEHTWSSFSALEREDVARPASDADRDSAWTDNTDYSAPGLSGYGSPAASGGYPSSASNGSGLHTQPGSGWDLPGGSEWTRPGGSEWERGGASDWPGAGSDEWSPPSSEGWTRSGDSARPGTPRAADPAGGYPIGRPGPDSYRHDSYPDEYQDDEAYRDPGPAADRYPGLGTPPEERTEQMPRYGVPVAGTGLTGRTASLPGPLTHPMPRTTPTEAGPASGAVGSASGAAGPPGSAVKDSGPSTAISSPADLFDDEDDKDNARAPGQAAAHDQAGGRAESGTRTPLSARTGRRGTQGTRDRRGEPMPDVPAGLAAPDDELAEDSTQSEAHSGSGLKAWAILIGQGIGGAIGGALLWVGFRYLWLNLPVVALAAAVVATAGLVLVVRTIRGSDDLQTTMLAVLVGLIVTISPAVLLLTLH